MAPRPSGCEFVSPLNWGIAYRPLDLTRNFTRPILLMRERWRSPAIITVVVCLLSALLLIPTVFGSFIGWFLNDMHLSTPAGAARGWVKSPPATWVNLQSAPTIIISFGRNQ
jgi:hypothetical protein